ncbi:MAG TPA: hypothetical protein VG711_08620 [Phycisphaerales bacterium]|nr:hypothetical protein [Phycisphaerales bacterium]
MKNRTNTTSANGSVIAVLHKTGTTWRALIAKGKASAQGTPSVLAVREWQESNISGLDAWFSEYSVSEALCIVPSSAVICRNTILPPSEPQQLQEALQLQAESTLLGVVPSHRLGLGVLPASPGEMNRRGIIVGWPTSSSGFAPPISVPVQYVPDICALAALMGVQRPEEPFIWADGNDGSIAIALSSPNGVILRSTREENGSGSEWRDSIIRSVAETAINANHSPEYVTEMAQAVRAQLDAVHGQSLLLISPASMKDAASRIEKTFDQRSWWNTYGICIGAMLARSGPLESVTHLLDAPPVETPSALGTVTDRLRQPRYALVTVVISLVILGLCPLIFNGMRLLILTARFGDSSKQVEAVDLTSGELGLYQVMQQRTWPMTKLLADIANNTPMSVELSSIRLEENSQTFVLSGTARPDGSKSPREIVEQMQANMLKDDLFTKLNLKWSPGNITSVFEFDMNGQVNNPFKRITYPVDRDFGMWSAQDRVDHKPAPTNAQLAKSSLKDNPKPTQSTTQEPQSSDEIKIAVGNTDELRTPDEPASEETQGDDDSGDIRESRRSSINVGGSGMGSLGDRGDAVTSGQEIPEAITAEQVNAMSAEMVEVQLVKVAKAKQRPDLDEDTKKRLGQEFRWLIDRKRAIREGSQ